MNLIFSEKNCCFQMAKNIDAVIYFLLFLQV